MRKGNVVKRKHSPQKDTVSSSSSSEEEQSNTNTRFLKKNSPQGKKPKERSSSATSENEEQISVDESSDCESISRKHGIGHSKVDAAEEVKSSNSKKGNTAESSNGKEQEMHDINIAKTEKSEKQLVSSIEDKMNISNSKNVKTKKNVYLFDFLGDEVSSDESQALQALSTFWVTTVARNKDVLKRPPPKNQKEQDFYNKYCDKQGKLSITAATHLMSLPHVITVCLKTTAQIEVVVSNRQKALEESEELRQDFFEIVEAMAMHLM